MAPSTFFELISGSLDRSSDRDLLGHRGARGDWVWTSGGSFAREIEALAAGLVVYGVRPGDRVAVLSADGRDAWKSEVAALACGACCVPLDPALEEPALRKALGESGARVVLVGSGEALQRVQAVRPDLSQLDMVLLLEEPSEHGALPATLVTTASRLGVEALSADPELVTRARSAVKAGDAAYAVSSPAGDGEGLVLLAHDNLTAACGALMESIPLGSTDLAASLIPAHHFAGRPWWGALLAQGTRLAFVDREASVAEQLRELRPTMGVADDRAMNRFLRQVVKSVSGRSLVTRLILPLARLAGLRTARPGLAANRLDCRRSWISDLADRMILKEVREAAGGRLRFFISVGEPLGARRVRTFLGLGLPVLEGAGTPATTGVLCQNTPGAFRPGSMGAPVPGIALRVDDDGGIWVRGPIVERGLAPGSASRGWADRSWLRSGLRGRQDADGFVHLV